MKEQKQEKSNVTVILPSENISQEETGKTLSIMTADQVADQEVQKFDLAKAWISQRKAEYSVLKIAGIDDKEGFKKVEEAWREIRNKRLAVANKHKELKADYIVITRKIDGAKNEFTELLEEIEKPLKQELDRIETLKEEEKNKAERELQERLQARVSELLENGVKFDGAFYSIGGTISMDVVTLKEMNPENYSSLLTIVKEKNAEIQEAAKVEAERKQKEIDDLAKQKAEQDAKEQELAKEREAIKKERREARNEVLLTIGWTFNHTLEVWEYKVGTVNRQVKLMDLGYYSPETWSQAIGELREIVKQVEEQAKEAEEKEKQRLQKIQKDQEEMRLLDSRVLELTRFGFVHGIDGFYVLAGSNTSEKMAFSPDQVKEFTRELFLETLDKAAVLKNKIQVDNKEAQEKADKKAEELRQQNLSEIEKVSELVQKLKVVYNGFAPVVTNVTLQNILNKFQGDIDSAEKTLNQIK